MTGNVQRPDNDAYQQFIRLMREVARAMEPAPQQHVATKDCYCKPTWLPDDRIWRHNYEETPA